MPTALKPAYLIHGDDHVRIASRRAALRRLAESGSGADGVEVLEGPEATPELAAQALCALTFAIGRRVIIVDGAERWKDADVRAQLQSLLLDMPAETTIAFFAREEGKATAPAALHEGVRKAGGAIEAEQSVKEWELPKWAQAQAHALGLQLDMGAAKALVSIVGTRQPQLLRELEKIAIECGSGAQLDAEAVAEHAAGGAERRIWTLADALVAREPAGAVRLFLRLREQGERVESMLYWMTRRLREALQVAVALEAGRSPADLRRTLRMPPKAADRFIADVRQSDATHLRRSLGVLADLELATRGESELDPDTLALRALGQIASSPG